MRVLILQLELANAKLVFFSMMEREEDKIKIISMSRHCSREKGELKPLDKKLKVSGGLQYVTDR